LGEGIQGHSRSWMLIPLKSLPPVLACAYLQLHAFMLDEPLLVKYPIFREVLLFDVRMCRPPWT